MSDLIYRQAAIDAINKALSRVFTEPCAEPEHLSEHLSFQDYAIVLFELWHNEIITRNEYYLLIDKLSAHYKWMDKIITDEEYNRIIDQLNIFWKG